MTSILTYELDTSRKTVAVATHAQREHRKSKIDTMIAQRNVDLLIAKIFDQKKHVDCIQFCKQRIILSGMPCLHLLYLTFVKNPTDSLLL